LYGKGWTAKNMGATYRVWEGNCIRIGSDAGPELTFYSVLSSW